MSQEWTFGTLKAYFDAARQSDKEAVGTALAAAEKAVNAALIASEKAILKAEGAADKRAEASNEIRQAMIDQQKNFAGVETVSAIRERLERLETAQTERGGKAVGMSQIATMFLAAVGVAGTLFTIVYAVTK